MPLDSQRERQLDREIERYRGAAIAALGQLEWIVRYLHSIRKSQLATALDGNRKHILEHIPSQKQETWCGQHAYLQQFR